MTTEQEKRGEKQKPKTEKTKEKRSGEKNEDVIEIGETKREKVSATKEKLETKRTRQP